MKISVTTVVLKQGLTGNPVCAQVSTLSFDFFVCNSR